LQKNYLQFYDIFGYGYVAKKWLDQKKFSSSSFGAVVGSGSGINISAALFYCFIDIFLGVQVLARA
jgi:hypothetical protein